jgi:hypothetical protein
VISAGLLPISLDYFNPDPGQIYYKMSWNGPGLALADVKAETALVRQEIQVLLHPPQPIPANAPSPFPSFPHLLGWSPPRLSPQSGLFAAVAVVLIGLWALAT